MGQAVYGSLLSQPEQSKPTLSCPLHLIFAIGFLFSQHKVVLFIHLVIKLSYPSPLPTKRGRNFLLQQSLISPNLDITAGCTKLPGGHPNNEWDNIFP